MGMTICLLYDGKEPIFLGYLIKNNNRAVFVEKKVVLQGTEAFDKPLKGCQRDRGGRCQDVVNRISCQSELRFAFNRCRRVEKLEGFDEGLEVASEAW